MGGLPRMTKKWKPPVQEVSHGQPFAGASFEDLEAYFKVKAELEKIFGPVEYESSTVSSVSKPSLYGSVSLSQFKIVSFARPVGREEIVDMRKKTLALEGKFQNAGRPLVELDPGYVTEYTVVRTSLEDDFHRIYFYDGIFTECLYYFERLSFRPWIHTPDFFRQPEVVTIFNDIRMSMAQ